MAPRDACSTEARTSREPATWSSGAGLAGAAAAGSLREFDPDALITVLGQEPHLPYERPGLSKDYLQGSQASEDLLVHPQDRYTGHRIDVRRDVRVVSLERAAHQVVTADGERMGLDVTIVHDSSVPLGRALGDLVGRRVADLVTSAGVTLVPRTSVTAVPGTGRVEAVELSDGRTLPARTVVLGVGIAPNTDLAEQAGLAVDDGVLVNNRFPTDDEAVPAVGDVARAHNDWVAEQVRLEHDAPASDGGPVAGRAMAGAKGATWAVPPLFRSDQFEVGLEYRGYADPARHHVVLRAGAPAPETGTPWFAFWHDAGRVVAGMHVDGWDDADTVTELVTSHAVVDVVRLADPAVPLSDALA